MTYGNLKSVKEISYEIGRSRTYVHAAKKAMEEARHPMASEYVLRRGVCFLGHAQ